MNPADVLRREIGDPGLVPLMKLRMSEPGVLIDTLRGAITEVTGLIGEGSTRGWHSGYCTAREWLAAL